MPDLVVRLQDALADRYRLEREVGRGGMATVFLAQDLKHDRPVALKVLHGDLAAALGPERFQREIRLAARLQHPHILTVLDSGEAAGHLWFTMPFVEGESLRDRLKREKQLPVEDAIRVGREAAQALEYAHQHDVIHRDIKPENLLLTRDGNTLVADFGIARALGGADEKLTETGLAVGTPLYMSPEQASAEPDLDARTDIYSLAVVLFEALAGEPPFTGATAQAIIARRLSGMVPGIRAVRPAVPESIEQVILRALAVTPADRFATMADFTRALTAAGGPPLSPPPPSASGAVPRVTGGSGVLAGLVRRPLFATLALGFLLGLGALFAWRRSHDATGERLVAVLPFENLGGPADEYFADGLADQVRGKLSTVPGLLLIAGGSANQYRHTSKSPGQIAHELGAQYLLFGKVRWDRSAGRADRVQATMELVQASSGPPTTKWQAPFDAALSDVFQVQGEIADRVAQALGVALNDSTRQHLAEAPTQSVAAYDAFLRGEAASQGMGAIDVPSLRRAVEAYRQAVALDSTFVAAWAQLARAQAILYYLSTPTPAAAELARMAAARALALGPERPEAHRAMSAYYANVLLDIPRAFAQDSTALALAPVSADLLVAVSRKEIALGRWEAAVAHLQQASRLDPLSVLTAVRLGAAFLWLRRYPEALQAYDRALALAPTNLVALEHKAMVSVAQGDLTAARAVISGATRVDRTALIAHLATTSIPWVLDEAQQAALVKLTPGAFDNDRGTWALVLAETYALRGDQPSVRIYADSARLATEAQLRALPGDARLHASLGLALAYLGRKADAIHAGEHSVTLVPLTRDAILGGALRHELARIYVLVNEPDKAVDQLQALLGMPGYLSRGWLRVDPTLAPLRGSERFRRLAEGG